MKKYFLLILFFFIIFPFRVQGEKLILKKVKSTEDLAGYFKFFEDKNKTLSVEDIQKLKEEKFSQITRETINFGLTDSINWVRLDIENQTNSNDWLLELTAPSIDSINYYFIKDENIFHSIAGDEEKYKNAMVLPN
ncbi:MAG: hypothetical protein KDK36_11015, partial [Leptospiraceae bacterium]|nr:hypothetical protein [Leptospiraceae bacterium]